MNKNMEYMYSNCWNISVEYST